MLFSSLPFLYLFLPLCVLFYFLMPSIRAKNAVLLVFSLVFYAWGEPVYVLLMLGVSAANWAFGLLMERLNKKAVLVFAIVFDLGCLAVFKYAGFLVENLNALAGLSLPVPKIALPIGISFYTFQILSYIVDVYRGSVGVQHSYPRFLLYVSLFPQLIAGPIVRYSDVEKEMSARKTEPEEIFYGVTRFCIGLAKKILIADYAGKAASQLLDGNLAAQSTLGVWFGVLLYAFEIYFDFSGYSDMAIGLGRIFGFRYPENFRLPYMAKSITEFWRRWHISLGSWFRDYLYIPLGGNRKGSARQLLNILLVWLATGLWHGAAWNFVLWGLLYAVLLTAEKLFLLRGLQKLHVLNHVYVLLFVTLGFVLFDASSVQDAAQSIRAMFGGGGLPLVSAESLYELRSCTVLLLLAVAGATPLAKSLCAAVQRSRAGKTALAVLEPVGLTALLAVCTAFLVDGSFNPFLYFRF